MNFSITALVALFFGFIVITKTLVDYRKKMENLTLLLFWVITWLAIIMVAFFPSIISEIILRFGNKSITIGQIFGMGFIFVLYVIYRVYIKANRLEKQLNELIRKIALKEFNNKK